MFLTLVKPFLTMENYIVPHYSANTLINRVNNVRQLIDIGSYTLYFVQIMPTTLFRVRLTRLVERPDAKIEDHLFVGTMQLAEVRALMHMKSIHAPEYPEGVELKTRETQQCKSFFKVYTK